LFRKAADGRKALPLPPRLKLPNLPNAEPAPAEDGADGAGLGRALGRAAAELRRLGARAAFEPGCLRGLARREVLDRRKRLALEPGGFGLCGAAVARGGRSRAAAEARSLSGTAPFELGDAALALAQQAGRLSRAAALELGDPPFALAEHTRRFRSAGAAEARGEGGIGGTETRRGGAGAGFQLGRAGASLGAEARACSLEASAKALRRAGEALTRRNILEAAELALAGIHLAQRLVLAAASDLAGNHPNAAAGGVAARSCSPCLQCRQRQLDLLAAVERTALRHGARLGAGLFRLPGLELGRLFGEGALLFLGGGHQLAGGALRAGREPALGLLAQGRELAGALRCRSLDLAAFERGACGDVSGAGGDIALDAGAFQCGTRGELAGAGRKLTPMPAPSSAVRASMSLPISAVRATSSEPPSAVAAAMSPLRR
jgi:hypothetical protein